MVSITVTTNTIVTLKVSIIIIYDNKHDDLYNSISKNNKNLKKENAEMSSIKKRREVVLFSARICRFLTRYRFLPDIASI